jgi:HSP20 family molecular chaperone IbpA
MELDYGPFRRELVLSADVDPERGRASYEQGLLTIVLPLAQRVTTTTKVPIEVRRSS